jgi:hypothetical protein
MWCVRDQSEAAATSARTTGPAFSILVACAFGLAEQLESHAGQSFTVEGLVDDAEATFAHSPNELRPLGAENVVSGIRLNPANSLN